MKDDCWFWRIGALLVVVALFGLLLWLALGDWRSDPLTPTPTYTALPPTMTLTPTLQAPDTATPTATNAPTKTPTPTASPTATPTERPTQTPTPRPRVTAVVLPTWTPEGPDELPETGGTLPDN